MQGNNKGLVEIECLSPHIFIHYEGKLRIKQFLELCTRLIDDVDSRPLLEAVSKYEEIINMCETCLYDLSEHVPESVGEANAKRQMLIGMLRRSKELEMEALDMLAILG